MNDNLALAIAMIVFFVSLIGGMPIAFGMILSGMVGFTLVSGFDKALSMLSITTFDQSISFITVAIPLFVVMGQLMFASGLVAKTYDTAYRWMSRLPGGLAITTNFASAAFAAITGSSVACAATMTSLALPDMRKYGYSMRLATGCLASSGTLGIMIPPSLTFIIYGMLTENSIGRLFIAGVIPGIILACLFALVIFVWVTIKPELAPKGPHFSWRERFSSLPGTLPVFVMFVLVIGGIYGGVFTPTEAAGVGAFLAIAMSLAYRRLSWKSYAHSLKESAEISIMVVFLMIGGVFFGRFVGLTGVSSEVVQYIKGISPNPFIVMLGIYVLYIILGALMDAMAMIVITLPFVYPLVLSMGYDPIWFGVVLVLITELALITPPVGLSVYVVKGVAKDIPLGEIFKGVAPFIIAVVALLLLLTVFPDIALVLPRTMIR